MNISLEDYNQFKSYILSGNYNLAKQISDKYPSDIVSNELQSVFANEFIINHNANYVTQMMTCGNFHISLHLLIHTFLYVLKNIDEIDCAFEFIVDMIEKYNININSEELSEHIDSIYLKDWFLSLFQQPSFSLF
jgi:hypothetical protein